MLMEAIGGYKILQEIGGWKTRWFIYSAQKLDDPKGTEVVLKICEVDDLEPNPPRLPGTTPAFLVAAHHQRGAAVRCAGIVPVLACGMEEGKVFNVTPRYTFSLERLIRNKLDVGDSALEKLTKKILTILGALQKDCGHGHGNIKPSNVFLAGNISLSKADIMLADLAPDPHSQTVAEDIHALGHLLHQLIRKRELTESFFPLQQTEEWSDLEGDAAKWLYCCNCFLDPALGQSADPLKIAREALRTSGRQAAGGTIKQGTKAIKEAGTSKLVQSTIWIALFLLLAVGAFLFLRHKLVDATGTWRQVHSEHHLWLRSVAAELSSEKTWAIWKESPDPQIAAVAADLEAMLENSPSTVRFVVNSPSVPAYDLVADRGDAYFLKGDKGDPGKVRRLQQDLNGLHKKLAGYFPVTNVRKLTHLKEKMSSAGWAVPNSLAKAAAFDPSNNDTLGRAISDTLPLVPYLFLKSRGNAQAPIDLFERIATNAATILQSKDPTLAAYVGAAEQEIALLFKEPIDSTIWEESDREVWDSLIRHDEGMNDLATFLKTRKNQIAFDRMRENAESLNSIEIGQRDFAKKWIQAAGEYLQIEGQENLRKSWAEQWARFRKGRSVSDELEERYQQLLVHRTLVHLDQTVFDQQLAELRGLAIEDLPGKAVTAPAVSEADLPRRRTDYQALLQKYIAQINSAPPNNVASIMGKFQSEVATFASLPGVQEFLDQISINLARKDAGWRPKGFPAATRPNPSDPQLFTIPLRVSFPFRLITPADSPPFFLAVWEVPIALLTAADFDARYPEGARYWDKTGGQLKGKAFPIWPQLQNEMIGKQGPVAPYLNPQAAAVPGGPQNWQALPANFVTPEAASRVAAALNLRLPTFAEWKAAYAQPDQASDGWLRGTTWKRQVDYIIDTVGAFRQENIREGVEMPFPDVFPTTRAYTSFDVSKKDDFDSAATQASLFFRPTLSVKNPPIIKDMRGNVSEIVTNGSRYAVVGPSVLSSPKFTGVEGAASLIPARESFSDVGFRFAVDAVAESGVSNMPQLFAAELQRLALP